MDNPQYIEYLNTYGAEIDVTPQPIVLLSEEHNTKKKEFGTLKRLFKQAIYHIRYKYYQCGNLVKKIFLDDTEIERTKLINSIEKLKNKE